MKDFRQDLDHQHDLPKPSCLFLPLFRPPSKLLNPCHGGRLPPKPSHDKPNPRPVGLDTRRQLPRIQTVLCKTRTPHDRRSRRADPQLFYNRPH